MILKLYDMEHNAIGGIKNHKDAKVESELSMGDKELSFSWFAENGQEILLEYYLQTDVDEYVVKEINKNQDGSSSIVAKLNLEEVEARVWRTFTASDCTALEIANLALADTGWTCISQLSKTKKRNISLTKVNSYQIFEKMVDAFICEIRWDTINKVVYLQEQVGEDKGAYFTAGLNLKELKETSDTYDFATELIPCGADDLDITSINDGKNYIANHQYSKKIIPYIWEDSSYTDAQALLDDAEYKLNEISKPKKTMQAKVIDLAKAKPGYDILSYSIGDTVYLINDRTGTSEKQRITKMVEYLESPKKNTCDLSNTVLSFAEMQKKLQAAAECLENITTDNGTVKGSTVDKIDISQIIGLDEYIAQDLTDFKADYIYARKELGAVYAAIGEAEFTTVKSNNLTVNTRADMELAYVTELHADTLTGGYATFTSVEADNISAIAQRVGELEANEITTEYLEANFIKTSTLDSSYAKVDFANIDVASIREGFLENLMVSQGIVADRVVGTQVVATNVLTGVNIYANDITAGTLSVDRLILRGSEDSLVYALNNSGELESTAVDTLDGDILTDRTVTADKIVANTITANEINVENLIATGLIEANKLTAVNIDVDDLFTENITASGSIQSSNYVSGESGMKLTLSTGEWDSKYFKIANDGKINATGGSIGGFTIGEAAIYNGPNSIDSTENGIYLGTDGFEQNGSDGGYVNISNGKITANNVDISGNIIVKGSIQITKDITPYVSTSVEMITLTEKADCDTVSWFESYDDNGITIITDLNYSSTPRGISVGFGKVTTIDSIVTQVERLYVTSYANLDSTLYVEKDAYIRGTILEGGTALSSKYQAKGSYAVSSHTHNYAGSSSAGGVATSAAKLSTARTLTIGSKGKTFDGSANVSWSLSEIGAAASSHTHNYLALSGGTLTGNATIGGSTTAGTFFLRVISSTQNVRLNVSAANAGLYHENTTGYATAGWLVYMNSSGTITHSTKSDKRQKNYISDLSEKESLCLLRELNPILYTYKSESPIASIDVSSGFYAQDVRDILKKYGIGYRSYLLIHKNNSEDDSYDIAENEDEVTYGLDYAKFVPTLWKGWQIHQRCIEELQKRVTALEN